MSTYPKKNLAAIILAIVLGAFYVGALFGGEIVNARSQTHPAIHVNETAGTVPNMRHVRKSYPCFSIRHGLPIPVLDGEQKTRLPCQSGRAN